MVRAYAALMATALLSAPARSAAKTVMVFGPHPDDEMLIAAGRARSAINAGDTVKIVIVTNGDYYGQSIGLARELGAVDAAEVLGLTEQDVIFMGYGDSSMLDIYNASSGTEVFTSLAGLTQTYGASGLGGRDYHSYRYGRPGPYARNTVLSDFIDLLTQFAPDEIYGTLGPDTEHVDTHPDHEATGRFLLEALRAIRASGSPLRTRAYFTFVWGASGDWPDDLELGFTPLRPYTTPDNIPLAEWEARLDFPVPPEMQTTDRNTNLKARAIDAYGPSSWLVSHARPTEFFWELDYCAGGACGGGLPGGSACQLPGQCTSNLCVDGYCCGTACSGQCQACDVAGHLGTCTAVTGAPHGTRAACTSDGSACGGACNGSTATACAYPGASTACRYGSCTAGVATLAASCDGAGACPGVQTRDCTPYVCGATACLTGCSSDSSCAAGEYCAAGACTGKRSSGAACTTSGQCASGSCVDGYCCNDSCSGQCQACDVAGHLGTCTAVTGAPHGTRAACASDGSACGGACNGSLTTACAYPGASTACRYGGCTAGVATLAASCDGAGACPGVQTRDCAPYVCGATACLTGCSSDSSCAAGEYCAAGACTGKRSSGAACTTSGQCASGSCVDGYCCNDSCSGQCQACDVAGHLGTCTPVTGAPHGTRAACASDGSACGGACNGSTTTACTYPGTSTTCRAASCAAGVATLAAACGGEGTCPAVQTQDCAPFRCGPIACLGDCQRDENCASGRFCSGGVCTARRANGAACTAATQCADGSCVDGYCCDAVCEGQCQACDVAGRLGTCTPVTGRPHGARTACAADGSVCAGSCDGTTTAACTYPGTDVACRAAACTAGTATLAASCDGAGACPAARTQPCSPYACGSTACLGDCDRDEDCTGGRFCAGGVCTGKLANGAACSAAGQCANGRCVDGYCCDAVCEGQCQACDVADHLGVCTPVLGAPHGGRAACPYGGADPACAGSCDGSETAACISPTTCAHEPGGGGGGGCSSGGDAGGGALALLGLALPRLVRRRLQPREPTDRCPRRAPPARSSDQPGAVTA